MTGKGTIYRKADLHIHTPASNCFSTTEKSVTAAQIVEEAKRKGLEIIGITDHNDIDSCLDSTHMEIISHILQE